LTNKIISIDPVTNLITEAAGNTVPVTKTGFKKGAKFTKLDAAGNGTYNNTGDETSCTFNLVDQADTADIPDGAVTAPKLAATLDMTSHALTNLKVEVGTPVNAVAASGVLTTDDTELTDGDTVTIGNVTYRFKDTMAQINDVKRDGTTADTTLANLVAAINGSGTSGVEWFAGTVANPDFTSSTVSAHAITVTANVKGVAGNAFAKTESSSHLDWDGVGAVMTGGVDGTVGQAKQILANNSYLYLAIAANTIADANSRRFTVGSVY
jgi:hypothetical protein